MRSLVLLALSIAAATPLVVATNSAQVSPSPKHPPAAPDDCYVLVPVPIPNQDRQYARRLVGGEWISGCIGPAGQCYIAIYVPC